MRIGCTRISRQSVRYFLGFGLGAGLLVGLDALVAYTYRPKLAWLEWSDWLSRLGVGEVPLVVSGLAFGLAWLRRDDRLGQWSLSLLVGVVVAGGVTFLLKSLIGRLRPYAMDGPWEFFLFHPFTIVGAWQSFPSGHATVMGVVVETVRRWYPHVRWVRWGAVLAAVLVGLARVTGRFHHPSDIVGGYLIGMWVTRYLMNGLAQWSLRMPWNQTRPTSRSPSTQVSDGSEARSDIAGQTSASSVRASESATDSPLK
ncbi:MAG: phosphatase PAP2 family protein [Acidobacteria bacterium]|nr:phosphatase PAP2 family protein [Acidobacteriota bacterium]MDW7983498.1 phosphatase PAP2 family protein [Acidobacteriota bacterium]